MLSILIPTYNVNIHPLVSELQQQLNDNQVDYEIIISDDASPDKAFKYHNTQLEKQENVRYIQHENNLGRSKTRNELADLAKYPYLLIMDCDARVKRKSYIKDYLDFISKKELQGQRFAVSGGLAYRQMQPSEHQMLRYKYGIRREVHPASERNRNPYHHFTPFNLLISKSVFETCRFDDTLTEYGYEDTFFGMELERQGIPVYHLDNEMYHDGLDDNRDFLLKITDSVRNLDKLYRDGKVDDRFLAQSRLLQTWKRLASSRHAKTTFGVLRMLRSPLKRLILQRNSLRALDLYKLILFDDYRRQAPPSEAIQSDQA